MKRLALRTGVRWKISIAIAAVGALIAVALSLVVHNAARVSMLATEGTESADTGDASPTSEATSRNVFLSLR